MPLGRIYVNIGGVWENVFRSFLKRGGWVLPSGHSEFPTRRKDRNMEVPSTGTTTHEKRAWKGSHTGYCCNGPLKKGGESKKKPSPIKNPKRKKVPQKIPGRKEELSGPAPNISKPKGKPKFWRGTVIQKSP